MLFRSKLCALSEYYQRTENRSEHEFVINYSSLSEEQIKEAIDFMSKEVVRLALKNY